MKYLLLLCFVFFASLADAQSLTNFEILRSKYYSIGMQYSIRHFDTYLHQLEEKRAQQKMSEVVYLRLYDSVDNLYRKQNFVVADIASKWAIMAHQRPSKLVKNTLEQVQKGKYTEAFDKLESKYESLNFQERIFLQEMSDFGVYRQQKHNYQGAAFNDSIAKIWETKYEPIGSTDSMTFVQQRRYLAHRFFAARDTVSAIGTMLLAKEINSLIKVKDTIQHQEISAAIAFDLATWQLQKPDVDNAFLNARASYELYQALSVPYLPREKAASIRLLASVYRIGGGNKESDSLFKKAIAAYQLLSISFPEYYKPILADVLQEHALVMKYFDKYDQYDTNIHKVIFMYKELASYNFPYFNLALGKNYLELGSKRMNTDVKIFLAQEEWVKARAVLEPIYKQYPLLVGDELCTVLYKLGGSKIALKEGAAAIPFFEQSLNIRSYLYKLAPSLNSRDYLDVLTQNATLNALDNRKETSLKQLEKAIKLANEMGLSERAQTIERFKKDVETH